MYLEDHKIILDEYNFIYFNEQIVYIYHCNKIIFTKVILFLLPSLTHLSTSAAATYFTFLVIKCLKQGRLLI